MPTRALMLTLGAALLAAPGLVTPTLAEVATPGGVAIAPGHVRLWASPPAVRAPVPHVAAGPPYPIVIAPTIPPGLLPFAYVKDHTGRMHYLIPRGRRH